MYLNDSVPTVNTALDPSLLTPPPISSVTDLALNQRPTFTVKLPSFDRPTLSGPEIAAIVGASLLFLFSQRKRR